MSKHKTFLFLLFCILCTSYGIAGEASQTGRYLLSIKTTDSSHIDLDSKNWFAFEGEKRLSQQAFFTIVGETDLAEEAKASETRRRLNLGIGEGCIGWGSTIIGTGLAFWLASLWPTPFINTLLNDELHMDKWGYALMGAGAVTVLASIPFFIIACKKQGIDAKEALELANEYNKNQP